MLPTNKIEVVAAKEIPNVMYKLLAAAVAYIFSAKHKKNNPHIKIEQQQLLLYPDILILVF